MKKLTALVLALVMVLGMCTTAFAINAKITEIVKPINTNNDFNGDVTPGTVWKFKLTADMFTWDDGVARSEAVSLSDLDRADIEIRTNGVSSNVMEVTLEGDSSGAYVQVEFNDSYMEKDEKKFKATIYLSFNSSRQEASKIILEGRLSNPEKTVSNNDSTLKMQDGTIYKATTTIQDVSCEVGEGVLIKARMYRDEKYGAVAYDDMKRSDDRLLNQYDDVYKIIAVDTLGFSSGSSTKVIFEDYEDDYIYDSKGEYLGRAPREMPLSSRYYISSRRYDDLSTSGSGNSASSLPSTPLRPSTPAGGTGSGSGNTANAQGSAISADTARAATASAVQAARAAGKTTASVRFKDVPSISAAALKSMPGSASGMAISLMADTMSNTAVVGRITVNPVSAANLTKDVYLGVYVDSAKTGSVKNLFEKWYSNKVEVVSLAHKSSFGMTVRIAAKLDLSRLNTKSLLFYSYDTATNKYTEIKNAGYSVDTAGYLHFNTVAGGEILITDQVMTRK